MMKTFDEVFEDKTKCGTKIKTSEYRDSGLHLIVDQGQKLVAGYTNLEEGLFEDVPAIIFGDHTRTVKYVEKPFFLGADGVKILKSKIANANYKYLYYALLNAKIPDTGYNRHFKWLKEVKINYPDLIKQQKMVDILDRIEKIVEEEKAQLEKLDLLIKARFVEMFGMPGTDVKGWGFSDLGKCCELNPKKGQDTRLKLGMKISFIPMTAVSETGNIDTSEIKMYDEVKSGFTYFSENDVLFAKITPCMENGKGAVAAGLCNNIGFGSTEFHVMRPIESISNSYWLYCLTSFGTFRKDAAANMTGSAGQRRVPIRFLDNYRVSLPPIGLQEQFAAFVRQTDKLKSVIQERLKETQLLFDSLMQQYFG